MNLLLLSLSVFSAVSAGTGVFLYARLRRKEAELRAANRQSAFEDPQGPVSKEEVAAIDQFLYDRCCRYMIEHRPFLVSSFSLDDLAGALYTNRSYLSKTINRFSGKNFRRYVNYYRVMYAMELYQKNMGLRVVELAHFSGFHSETSFYQSFKNVMGETPREWCDRMRRKYAKKTV